MDWPDPEQNLKRFATMTDMFRSELSDVAPPIRLLDFACGTSHFYGYLQEQGWSEQILYTGIDINPYAIEISRAKYPDNTYACMDILEDAAGLGHYDYITINGLFTQKKNMTEGQMRQFLHDILTVLFPLYLKGLAFNAMSGHVDYRKDDAFHLDLNWIADLMVSRFSRNFVFRHDYGLYENTIFLYKNN
jgi:SAM-dependent methyltransferase